ncbi:MAG TPA: asparagine synthase (glutamine-hydrolyzing) [Chloroflexota bacterium]|jgi:asparagine synthase (glutamine-hydrolysing)|nr:asparagine synthase (glutamine-hydrolyzing) [Chloroflexota bacterium]
MCGIAAVVANDPVPEDAVAAMTASLAHRGPDACASVRLVGCDLGHRRLSVLDLATGDQPMTDHEQRYWIVFNGEIFNFRELRAELERRGARFRTQSDTEVLLEAYRQFGDETPGHLNGQFAFAIWDTRERRLFAARDRLGEKPLYWARSSRGEFVLASELKALLASGLVEPRLDLGAVDAYLALLYVPPDRTIYQNVYTVGPGHALSYQDGQLRQWRYWAPRYSHRPATDPVETVQQVRALVAQAVRRQMVADVPVGAFLSGGLDSTTIVALMTEQTEHRVKTFSVGFGGLINELPYARAVADTYRTEHHEIQMEIPVGEMLERMAEVYDEPFADSSNIPTYLVAQYARQRVKVALAGDGGDELFGGYDWYRWLFGDAGGSAGAEAALWQLAALGARALARAGAPLGPWADAAAQRYRLAWARHRYRDVWPRHLALTTGLLADRSALWGGRAPEGTFASVAGAYRPDETVKELDRATDFDLRSYLPGDILVKVDRAAMAHGLESRAPFLDVDLVEFVLGLPWQERFRDGELKRLLRAACADLWPESVRGRGKMGFGAPIRHWLERPDVRLLLDRVTAAGGPLAAVLPGVRDALPTLGHQPTWTLLCLGLWLERNRGCLGRRP